MPSMLRTFALTCVSASSLACGRGESAELRARAIESEGAFREFVAWYPDDSLALAAERALSDGRAWAAMQLLEPALRDSARRSSAHVLLAAKAAFELEAWGRVEGLLANAPWLDRERDGEGHALLARTALARGPGDSAAARVAVVHAAVAVRAARTAVDRATRQVLLARALELRADPAALDSAARAYSSAASLVPRIHDWLVLRSAAVSRSGEAREALYRTLELPLVRSRARLAEARARERHGDSVGAAALFDSLGLPVNALRLRMAGPDPQVRTTAGRSLVQILERGPSTPVTRDAIALLDSLVPRLPAEDELTVGRSAAAAGLWARVARAFARAGGRGGAAADRDHFLYGQALLETRQYVAAAAQFAAVRAGPQRHRAAYLRGVALLRGGNAAAAERALRAVGEDGERGGETSSAASTADAMALLADVAADRLDDARARALLLDVARRFPSGRQAAPARFRAGLIAFSSGQYRNAAAELDSLLSLDPAGAESNAAAYWAARAWQAVGDTARARARWRELVRRSPFSFYGVSAAQRLGVRLPESERLEENGIDDAVPRAAVERLHALEALELDDEANVEFFALISMDSTPAWLAATARAFRGAGDASRAVSAARRAVLRGAPNDSALLRAGYPLPYAELLREATARHRLDLPLVAALIRQESTFNPRAISRAGARGLMQVMPAVGREIAGKRFDISGSPALLDQPDVSITLGTAHLAAALRSYSHPAYALAAYNAGGSRVRRWRTKRGATDPEMFIERIPFTETRDYVRIVLRDAAIYRRLLSLSP